MDVYKFINSKGIRSHCEKTGHKFNPLETAFLIYQSDHHTAVEKHAVWNELICTMPDVVIRRRANCEHHDSLHEFLRKYIALENKLLEEYDSNICRKAQYDVIRTFLEAYDFTGKVIVPFATSGGSGLGRTAETLQELVPAAVVKDGRLLNGRIHTEELKKWADNLEK